MYDYGGPARTAVPVASFLAERVGGSRAVPWHYVPDGSPEITEVEWFGPDELPEGIQERELMQDSLRGTANDQPAACSTDQLPMASGNTTGILVD